jgi:hypothetical protein
MEPALPCIFGLPPSLIMPLSVQFGFSLGMRLCEGNSGYLQEVVFMQNFWNFKAILDTEIISTLVLNKLVLKKFK